MLTLDLTQPLLNARAECADCNWTDTTTWCHTSGQAHQTANAHHVHIFVRSLVGTNHTNRSQA